MTMLGPRFRQALDYAAVLHADQRRKGAPVPYVSHLLAVTALVLEHGGDEDQAVAALLHDAVEDQGGLPVLEEIRRRFGDRPAAIVEACTDCDTLPKPPWRERKERFIAALGAAPAEARLVILADKVHNVRTILLDYRTRGDEIWSIFRGGREGTLWYYRSLADIFARLASTPLQEELDRTVSELERLAGTR